MATSSTINLAAATRNLVVEQGASVEIPFEVSRLGFAQDLTGYMLNMQVRRSFADTAVLINCTQANGRLVWVNQSLGKFKLVLEPAATTSPSIKFTAAELQNGAIEAIYDLQMTTADSGAAWTGVKGSFTILREVTRV